MKKTILSYLSLHLFLHAALASSSEPDWQLIKDENGIKVFTFETTDSDIVKAKAQTVIKASLERVRTTLDDIDHRHEWVPFLKVSKALSEYKNNKRIEYSHFSAPWPASDRDFVYQIELINSSDNKLVYKMFSVESELKENDNSYIRADLFESIYTLESLDSETTAVELIFHADPKGWLPNWITNIIQRVLPFKILRNLRNRLNSEVI
ncbi:MAG: START domain-containing protein [Gammaproteobacteria bacterium]|nr:START domain-containing protein [Gammaproteobacteria bacterium]